MRIYKYKGNHPNSPKGEGPSGRVLPYRRAIDVADLVEWAYGRERAHLMPGRVGPAAGSVDSIARVERVAMQGGFVDGGGVGSGSAVHPDAEAVHEAVMRFRDWRCGVLIEWGTGALEPDPLIGQGPRFVAVRNGKGMPRMIRDHNRNAIACEVRQVGPSFDHLVFRREIYIRWWTALRDLAEVLRGEGLGSHTVTGPAADPEPWELAQRIERAAQMGAAARGT